MSWYLDSSAILKLVFDEQERVELLKVLTEKSITSRISRLEVARTVSRIAPDSLLLANSELQKLDFFPLSNGVLSTAEGFTAKTTLRTLDAIHVATVIFLGSAINGLISYDKQMVQNAKELGLKVLSPGAK